MVGCHGSFSEIGSGFFVIPGEERRSPFDEWGLVLEGGLGESRA